MSTLSTMTTAQLLALPDDGVERELIRGELRERPMTRRNRLHAAAEARIAQILRNWLEQNPQVAADVLSGEAGAILAQQPDTTVGIDVAVFSLDTLRGQTDESRYVVGIPLLAVEILSPTDKHEEIHEKIKEYQRVGVPLIWEVDPDFRTVRVHQLEREPVMFNRQHQLTAEPILSGFETSVSAFFPDW
ncbi:MAG: Uma2 family endonuclease [bacterium]|nr:Uma2 family endonuclease [bacterium]